MYLEVGFCTAERARRRTRSSAGANDRNRQSAREMGVLRARADLGVVPDEVVVFEEAARREAKRRSSGGGGGIRAGEESCHWRICTKPLIQLAKCSKVLRGRKNQISRTANDLRPHYG